MEEHSWLQLAVITSFNKKQKAKNVPKKCVK